MKPMLPYQEEAVSLLSTRARYGVFHDCGLGKTRIVMEDLKRCPREKYVLWVTKASLRTAVADEWIKWGGNSDWVQKLTSSNVPCYGINVVSHQFLARDANIARLLNYDWCVIVVDEAHRFKNWQSKSTRNLILKVGRSAKVVRLMTATPYVKSAADLHPLLSFLEPGKWGQYKKFAEKYANKRTDRFNREGFRYDGVNSLYAEELGRAIKEISTRKTRHEVSTQLPQTQYITLYVEAEDTSKDLNSEELKQKLIHGDLNDDCLVTAVRQIGQVKMPIVLDWIEDQERKPTIVATWFRDTGEAYERELTARGYRTGLIYGGVSEEARRTLVEMFQEGELDTLVLAIGAAGEGINLDKCERVIFAENPWSYTDRYQMLSRAVRLTTKHSVVVYTVVLRDTLDEMIVAIANSKGKGAEHLGLGV